VAALQKNGAGILTRVERKGVEGGKGDRKDSKPATKKTKPTKTLATLTTGRTGGKPLQEILGERRVAGLRINLDSMALVSNIHRASMFIRDHFERTVLEEAELHWSAFVTLWCLWIYGELETRRLAIEAGIAKSTLSSILNMLEGRKLVRRRTNELERRLVIVNLTAQGAELIASIFPKFNAEETRIVERLSPRQMQAATDAIRIILATITDLDGLAPED
jgi:DNA-binding MarR family transcriptional regulator